MPFIERHPELVAAIAWVQYQDTKIPSNEPVPTNDNQISSSNPEPTNANQISTATESNQFLARHPLLAEGIAFIQDELKHAQLPAAVPLATHTTKIANEAHEEEVVCEYYIFWWKPGKFSHGMVVRLRNPSLGSGELGLKSSRWYTG